MYSIAQRYFWSKSVGFYSKGANSTTLAGSSVPTIALRIRVFPRTGTSTITSWVAYCQNTNPNFPGVSIFSVPVNPRFYRTDQQPSFGSVSSRPALTLARNGHDVAWSPSGAAIIIVGETGGQAQYIQAFRWNANGAGSLGTAYSTSGLDVPTRLRSVRFSPDGSVVFFSGATAPYLVAYKWSDATGFGTRYDLPVDPPTSSVQDMVVTNDGTAVIVSCINSPYMIAYPWSNETGFGERYADPVDLPPSGGGAAGLSATVIQWY